MHTLIVVHSLPLGNSYKGDISWLRDNVSITGICNMIEAEDGTGHRFNLHIQSKTRHVIYVDLAVHLYVRPSPIKSWVEIR